MRATFFCFFLTAEDTEEPRRLFVCGCPRAGQNMKHGAVTKKSEDWLIDLPGVNVQEKIREELLRSLAIGAQDMLATEVPFEPGTQLTAVDIPEPEWASP